MEMWPRVALSPQEQIIINNIIQQFTTVRNNITQVINIINNVARPPPTNNTGGEGGNTTDPLTVQANLADIDQEETLVVLFETVTDGGRPPYACEWDLGDGTTSNACNVSHIYENPGTYTATVTVTDTVGQTASDSTEEFSITNTGGGGNNTITVEELPVNGPPPPPPPPQQQQQQQQQLMAQEDSRRNRPRGGGFNLLDFFDRAIN